MSDTNSMRNIIISILFLFSLKSIKFSNMKSRFVLLMLVLIEAHLGVTKRNYLSKCSHENNDQHVNYECGDSDKFIEKSDLSCCILGCHYPSRNYTPTSSVKSLKFLNCTVQQLGIDIFGKYSLTELNLSNMDLQTLQPKDFHQATQLQKLDVSHNSLTKLTAGLLINASKLKQLNFSNNQIDYIDEEAFRTSSSDDVSSNIETINLSHNQIHSIGNQTFVNLSALIEVNLEDNLIETLDTEVFSKNPNLKRVRLDGNKLKEFICSGHFVIYDLNVSFNRIERFNASCIVIYESLRINIEKYENQESAEIAGKDGPLNAGNWKLTEDDLSKMNR